MKHQLDSAYMASCCPNLVNPSPILNYNNANSMRPNFGMLMVQASGFTQHGVVVDKFKAPQPAKSSKDLFCNDCKIQCNSELQYEVHILSTKHKTRVAELSQPLSSNESSSSEMKSDQLEASLETLTLKDKPATDENNSNVKTEEVKPKKCKHLSFCCLLIKLVYSNE